MQQFMMLKDLFKQEVHYMWIGGTIIIYRGKGLCVVLYIAALVGMAKQETYNSENESEGMI